MFLNSDFLINKLGIWDLDFSPRRELLAECIIYATPKNVPPLEQFSAGLTQIRTNSSTENLAQKNHHCARISQRISTIFYDLFLFYDILFCDILFYDILLYFISRYFILRYSTLIPRFQSLTLRSRVNLDSIFSTIYRPLHVVAVLTQ